MYTHTHTHTYTLTQTYILIRLLALFRYLYIFSALLGDLILEYVIKLFLSFFLSIFLSWSRTSSPTFGTTFAYSLNISETRFRRAKKICHKTREKSSVPSIDSLVPILSLLILLWDNFVMPVSLMDVIPWNQGLIKESRLKHLSSSHGYKSRGKKNYAALHNNSSCSRRSAKKCVWRDSRRVIILNSNSHFSLYLELNPIR